MKALALVAAMTVYVDGATRYVALNGAHQSPFDTWAKAATNILDAVDVALAGDDVLVSNGVYSGGARVTPGGATSNRVVIAKAVTVRSLNGPGATMIMGSGPNIYNAVRCVYVAGGGTLSGFTLTNGHTRALPPDTVRSTDTDGGGVLLGPDGCVSNCVIAGNACVGYGGGACVLTNSLLTHCVIAGNTADDGGGVYMITGACVRNCAIEANQATGDGGGVYCDRGGRLRTCLITRNHADYAGVYCFLGGEIESCTITRNSTGGNAFSSDGVYCFRGGALRNSIIYHNLPGRDFKYYTSYDGMWYCCVPGGSVSGSNIVAAPQFMDLTNGNYRLQASSPCISRGLNEAWMSTARDLDGQPRIVNTIVDMGAYEAGVWQCEILASIRTGMAPLSVTLTAHVSGSNATNTAYYWDVTNDGVIDQFGTALVSIVNVYTAGMYSVRLLASNAFNQVAQQVKTNMIVALPPLGADFVASRSQGPTAMTVHFTDLSAHVPQFWRWDLNGDGAIDSTVQHPSFTYLSAGVYSVTLSVSNNFGTAGGASCATLTKTNLITITNAVHTTHYVAPAGAHISPFISWSEAATNLQDAVDAASPGELVLVADGVYANGYRRAPKGDSGARVSVVKPVTVRSVNGPGATMILGGGYLNELPVRGAFLSNGAVLCGFTISNGLTSSSDDLTFDQHGGGVYMGWNSMLSNCCVTACYAFNRGGGVYAVATSTVAGCTVVHNEAGSGGGGLNCGPGTVHDCVIEHNRSVSVRNGGGVRATVTVLERCIIRGNAGVGVRFDGAGWARNCMIISNNGDYGGGVYNNNGAILESCFIAGNYASESGGGINVYISGAARGCTVVGNRARGGGGGISSPSAGWIENSIVYYNEAPVNPNCSIGKLPMRYSCTSPLLAGIGNFTNDPGLLALGNPHIAASSPCIDAGTNVFSAAIDIDGEARISGGRIDIGCDEYIAAGITGALRVSIVPEYTNIGVGYAARFWAGIEGKASAAEWQFGDGASVTDVAVPRHAWAAPGTYQVRLTAWNNERMAAATTTVTVSGSITNYVALGGGHVAPFITWSTAATTLHAAVTAALPGNHVLVAAGTYPLATPVELTKPLTVRSVSGAASTVLRGTVNGRCVSLSCLETIVFDGFTITNGATTGNDSSGGGMYFYGQHRMMNCSFAGNSAGGYPAWGGGLYFIMGGTISNCQFIGNSAERGGGLYGTGRQSIMDCIACLNSAEAGGGMYLDGAGARNCLVYGNAGGGGAGGVACVSGAGLADSVVTNNTTTGLGGGVSASLASTVTNCVISGNSAASGGGVGVLAAGVVVHCRIDNNSASAFGGGVYFSEGGSLNVCTVMSNTTAYGRGGGAYVHLQGTITGGTIADNTASNGGGVYCYSGGLVSSATLARNRADTGGGAFFHSGGVLSNALVKGNYARQGGGVYSATTYGTMFTSKLHDNVAGEQGGALYSTTGGIYVRSCELAGNTASNAGGGAYWLNAYSWMWLENSSVASNHAPHAGGVYAAGAGTLMNTIVYHNDGGDFTNIGTSATVRYSCLPALVAGVGNITNAPLFKDLDARDLRLQDASPCMDAGTNLPWMASAPDINGLARRIGPQVDMGAHEATRGALIQLTPRTYLYLLAMTGSFASGTVRIGNLGRTALTGEVLGVGWPFAIEAGSPSAYVIGGEASTSIVFRFDAAEEGWTNIAITFTGGGDAAFSLYGESYIPEPGLAGLVGLLAMYHLQSAMWRRRFQTTFFVDCRRLFLLIER